MSEWSSKYFPSYKTGGETDRDIISYFEARFWTKETPKGRWGHVHSETKRIEDDIYGVWNEEERRAVGDNLGYKMTPKWILENSQQNFEK